MCPDEIRPLLKEYHDLVPFDEYPAYLASLNLDIAVAPLTMTPFNQGKSNLRLLEYGALGIPVVCTDIDPYRNSPACRVENAAGAWIAALRERIYDAEGREQEGIAMRDWVHRTYLLEDHLEEWLGAHLPG
jgi:glycosyltransferase involved in cell wall biosynthesis